MDFEESNSLRERVKAEKEKWAEPLDLAALERRGIISKAGAWYRLHKFDELPEGARARMYAFTNDRKGLKAKFSKRKVKLARRKSS